MRWSSERMMGEAMGDAERYCIVGAGPSGLAAAKCFKEHGIPFEVIERWHDVGGLWDLSSPHSTIYHSTHLITSKPLTEYPDFPMPEEYPDYPHHTQALSYLRAYARHFDLYPHIEFGREVTWIERDEDGWRVSLDGGEERGYAGVVIANGHLSDPIYPEVPGHFDGLAFHSAEYKTPEVLDGGRVLIVGLGNTACDIAEDAAHRGEATFLSVRGGNYVVPKYLLGKPADQFGSDLTGRLPVSVRQAMDTAVLRLLVGRVEKFGLPAPRHGFYERTPIVNSRLLERLGHGSLSIKPRISELRGGGVLFEDGSEEDIDVIVWCTGFRISFPFIDERHLNWDEDHPDLYLNIFHPDYDDLFVSGLIESSGGGWGTRDQQASLIAKFIRARQEGSDDARRIQEAKHRHGSRRKRSRNGAAGAHGSIYVDYHDYKRKLDRLLESMS